MADLKPITVYTGTAGPNPLKVFMILESLSLPYTKSLVPDVKAPAYTSINPNGRVPAIHDPNTGLTLWESCAIIDYLIATYDQTHHLLSYPPGSADDFHCKQWLLFQASGQGPYFGQHFWFEKYHAERLPSAIERYAAETKRVVGVLEAGLERNGSGWLVGDKCTYADVAFFVWNAAIPMMLEKEEGGYEKLMQANPNFKKWHRALVERPAVKKIWLEWLEGARARGGAEVLERQFE